MRRLHCHKALFPGCAEQASRCGEFSCCGARAPCSCSAEGQPLWLQGTGSTVVAHGASLLCGQEQCGIFQDQGLNPVFCTSRRILYLWATREAPRDWFLTTIWFSLITAKTTLDRKSPNSSRHEPCRHYLNSAAFATVQVKNQGVCFALNRSPANPRSHHYQLCDLGP